MEKEREENIWRRKKKMRRRGKNREGKRGKYLDKEDIFWRRRRRMEKEKCCRRQVEIGGSMT